MEGSCTDESTTSESISLSGGAVVSLSPKAFSAYPPVPESVCRVGSGSSVIMDESGVEAESRKLPSSKYKGVVPQPNGRWGAQIYEKHQRVWLGTFNEEDEAARAYDIAAQRFRGRDAITNFKTKKHQSSNTATTTELNDVDEDIESAFLNSHSKAEIVDMLRKHTYDDELEQSKRHLRKNLSGRPATVAEKLQNSPCTLNGAVPKAREQLFEKAVTPSDVGKLNRLVIPKQHAEKHFPLQNINGNKNVNNSTKGVLLNFEDVSGKVWRFRYSYWNSSQSYVLTKGWSRFVKEKNLKAGDVVCFQRSTNGDKQLYIDWKARAGGNCTPGQVQVQVQVQPVQMVRLFGVNIFKVPAATGGCNNIGKRSRSEMELLNLEYSAKKQRVIGAL